MLRKRKLLRLLSVVVLASWAVFALVVYSAISRGQMSAGAIALAVVGIGVALAAMRASRMGVEMSDAGVTMHRPFCE